MKASCTVAVQPDGREVLVVVVKGTFAIPRSGEEPRLAEEQAPLFEADVLTGEPGFSAPLYEIDFARRKPRCDVLLNGSAYAPGGQPADRVPVSLRVGSLTKSLDVVGNRVWKAGALYLGATSPEPFTKMPISYNNAFGGVDKSHDDPMKWRWYLPNHAGVGYHVHTSGKFLDGKPMPNTEEAGKKIKDPQGKYRPMAFGPVGRSWQPRVRWVGTYDEQWLADRCPFLPSDFDDRYFQAAPEDQQTDYLTGGEEAVLLNLTPEGRSAFRIPNDLGLPVLFALKSGEEKEVPAVVDTLLLEPDERRFMLVWRAGLPLRRNLLEVRGAMVRTAQQAREIRTRGKRRFMSLAELAASKRK
jgi:hypothetical protein